MQLSAQTAAAARSLDAFVFPAAHCGVAARLPDAAAFPAARCGVAVHSPGAAGVRDLALPPVFVPFEALDLVADPNAKVSS